MTLVTLHFLTWPESSFFIDVSTHLCCSGKPVKDEDKSKKDKSKEKGKENEKAQGEDKISADMVILDFFYPMLMTLMLTSGVRKLS